MKKQIAAKLVSYTLNALAILWFGVRIVADFIGYTTLPDDAQVAHGLLEGLFDLALGVPLWVPIVAFLASFAYMIFLFWPDFRGLQLTRSRLTEIESQITGNHQETAQSIDGLRNSLVEMKAEIQTQMHNSLRDDRRRSEILTDQINRLKGHAETIGMQAEGICRHMIEEHAEKVGDQISQARSDAHTSEMIAHQNFELVQRNIEQASEKMTNAISEVRAEMTDLKKAREKGKIDDFIKEHEADPDGDLDKLDEVIKRPSQGSGKATPKASPRGASDD